MTHRSRKERIDRRRVRANHNKMVAQNYAVLGSHSRWSDVTWMRHSEDAEALEFYDNPRPGTRPARRAFKAAQPMSARGQFFGRLTPHWMTPSQRWIYVEPVTFHLGSVALSPNGELKAVDGRHATELYREYGPIDFLAPIADRLISVREVVLVGREFGEQRYGLERRAVVCKVRVYSEKAEDALPIATRMIRDAFEMERKARNA